jgi:sulfate transport system substrate-binding protein
MNSRKSALLSIALAASLVLAACGSSSSSSSGTPKAVKATGAPSTISAVLFSTPQAAYEATEAQWKKTAAGGNVTFQSSYGASGDQSRAVDAGKKADYVGFSLETDMTRLVKDGKVAASWSAGPTKGIVSRSVVVLVVRKGNPKHIKGWADLIKPGVQVVTPDPGSSGSARWNILAAWAYATQNGGTDADGEAYLTRLFKNTVALPDSGRDATTAFTGGTGDVLISYENEAIFARQNNAPVDYFIPDITIQIDNPGAVTVGSTPQAKDFLNYVISKPGQTQFMAKGFRPVISGVSTKVEGANNPTKPFPAPKKLVTISDLGGWSAVATKFFAQKAKDGTDGIVTTIENSTCKGSS